MNRKGFTLIEVLGVLAILGILSVVVITSVHSTVSVGQKDAYKIRKNNIISVSDDYINECVNHVIECDFSFDDNNRFSAKASLFLPAKIYRAREFSLDKLTIFLGLISFLENLQARVIQILFLYSDNIYIQGISGFLNNGVGCRI